MRSVWKIGSSMLGCAGRALPGDCPAVASLVPTRTQHILGCIVVLAALHLPGAVHADTGSSADRLWAEFRANHPFHIQTVALSDPGVGGERVLVITEPPPTLVRSQYRTALAVVFGSALKKTALKKHPVGYDGWVQDLVATVKFPAGVQGDLMLRESLALLARRMFGTSYKFGVIRLGASGASANRPEPATMAPPNLSVSAAELYAWLFESGAKLVSLDSGILHTAKELLAGGRPGVYLSEQRGFVLLLLPRDEPIEAYRADIRKFALDTDVIVGALASGAKRIALVGRERDTPVMSVPPLRTETILALAQTKEGELGQSYERRSAFAGGLSHGRDAGTDWAPIYLSHDLINTEFGSLLNITDQILKSWSEAGTIEYVRFPYKKPQSFPFTGGLLRYLGTKEVTYNWNTVGVGAVFKFGETEIFALNRTGALPVSYFPEGMTEKQSATAGSAVAAENDGYDYFSGLRDPYLGRVVQYTAIYQIFRAFPVLATRDDAWPQNYRVPQETLAADTRKVLTNIMNGTAVASTARIGDQIDFIFDSAGKGLPEEMRQAAITEIARKQNVQLAQATKVLQDLRNTWGPRVIDPITLLLADRAALVPRFTSAKRTYEHIIAATSDQEKLRRFNALSETERADLVLFQDPSKQNRLLEILRESLQIVGDMGAVQQHYARAAASIESGYIKTPSIALSLDTTQTGTGGHNLYSRATRIETSLDVPRGQVVIDTHSKGTKVLRINPEDAPLSKTLARTYERNAADPEVVKQLNAELARGGTVRETRVALALNDAPVAGGRGLTRVNQSDLAVGEIGPHPQRATGEVLREVERTAEARNLDLIIERDANGYLIYRFQPRPSQAVRAPTETSMLETIDAFTEQTARSRLPRGEPPVRLGTGKGLSEGELHGILKTQELRTAEGGGGWKPPSRPSAGTAAGAGEPNGRFFRFEKDGDAAGGYIGRNEANDPVVLRITARDANRAKAGLQHPVDWSRAEIRPLGASPGTGMYQGQVRLGYEITLPIKDVVPSPSAASQQSLLVRVFAYFRELSDPDKVRAADRAVAAAVATGGSRGLVGIDGIALLKSEILRNVKPAALEFHVTVSGDDLIIVRRDASVAG